MTTKTDEQDRAELLPCPFCGENKNLIVQHCEGTIIHPAYRIYCDNCGGSNGYTDRADHVESWNRRAALQSQDREDAERYRYLRVQDNYDFEFAVVKNPHFDVFQSPQELDEAIDHAVDHHTTYRNIDVTNEQLEVIRALRDEGFAVIVWTPEELGTTNPRRVEDRSVELGWDVIDALKD